MVENRPTEVMNVYIYRKNSTRFVKSKISWQRAGHGVIHRQRGGASVSPGRPAAHLSVIVQVQQVRGGKEGGRTDWGLAEGKICGAQRRTAQAPWAQVRAGWRVTPRAARCLFGAILTIVVAVRSTPRKRRMCIPLDLGGGQWTGGEVRGGRDIFSAGDDGVRGIVSCRVWRELRAGASITACPLWAWNSGAGGWRLLFGNWIAGLQGEKIMYYKRLIKTITKRTLDIFYFCRVWLNI